MLLIGSRYTIAAAHAFIIICMHESHAVQPTGLPDVYEVEDITQNGSLPCPDCKKEPTLYVPKNITRQEGETAMFRCVVPRHNRTLSVISWTHKGEAVRNNGYKYRARLYVWREGLFAQLKIHNISHSDAGEVSLQIPAPAPQTFTAYLTVVGPIKATVGQGCLSLDNCVDTNAVCLMPGHLRMGKCACKRENPVYIPDHYGCFRAVHGNDSCFHSFQCQYFVTGSQCVDTRCVCPGNTVVAFGACVPALGLGSICNDTAVFMGQCSVFMSHCDNKGTCSCIPETQEYEGECHIAKRSGGMSDWRTWLCYLLAFVAFAGVIAYAGYHRTAILTYCERRRVRNRQH